MPGFKTHPKEQKSMSSREMGVGGLVIPWVNEETEAPDSFEESLSNYAWVAPNAGKSP